MPTIEYRPMTVADVDATTFIRKAALESLDVAQGRARTQQWEPRRFPHFDHLLRTDPTDAWVAVVDGTVVAYAMGFVRGDIWFLAQLFVIPELHNLGLGRELLRRCLDAGRAAGARLYSVVSSTSPAAQSMYMRSGMFATGIMYRLSGPVDVLRSLPKPDANRKIVVDCQGWQDRVAALDRVVWGAERREDHGLYLSGAYAPDEFAFALTRDGELLGYGYADPNGHIGPLAATEPGELSALLHVAGEWLADHEISESFGAFLSHNPAVLRTLLNGGWKVNGWTFFLTSAPYGQFDRYVPSGGLLL